MKRTFVRLDTPRYTFVSLELTTAPGSSGYSLLVTRRGAWGNKGRKKEEAFDASPEAIQDVLDRVQALLEEGYLELPDFIFFVKGRETLQVRPPVIPEYTVITKRQRTCRFDTTGEAIQHYNAFIADKTRTGFSAMRPRFHFGLKVPSKAFENRWEPEEGEPTRRFYYQRLEAPEDEFGPEWWYHPDGALRQTAFQMLTRVQGPCAIYHAEGHLQNLKILHEGRRTASIIFEPDGTIGELGLYDARGRATSFIAFSGERQTLFTETGKDLDDERVGVWESWDDENHIIKEYDAPGVLTRLTFERHDGTLEQVKRFDGQGRNIGIDFHDEAGTLTQTRSLDDTGTWHSQLFHPDGSTVRAEGPLEDGARHGTWRLYDSEGALTEEVDYEGGKPVTDPIAAVFTTLEAGSYVPTPSTRPYSELYDTTHAGAANLPETLEDPIARLYCVAHHEPDALKPPRATRGAWVHTSEAGSKLTLKRSKGRVTGGTLHRPDGTLAADFSFSSKEPNPWLGPHLHVTLYHADGEASLRSGDYAADFPYNAPDTVHVRRDGWWFDALPDGRLSRAQHFSSGSYNLNADHHFEVGPDAHADLADERDYAHHATAARDAAAAHEAGASADPDALARLQRDFEEGDRSVAPRLAQLARRRNDPELLARVEEAAAEFAPSRERFRTVCAHLEQAWLHDPARTETELIPTLEAALKSWPSRLRAAPLLWINRLISGALPLSALRLTTALSLAAALMDHNLNNRHYPALIFFLRNLPEDAPALEGLSLSLRDTVCEALKAEVDDEPAERFHPASFEDVGETYHIDSAHLGPFFGSPLARELRVLDASLSETSRDFYWTYQGFLDGRHLTLGDIAENLRSERLEVLDLFGRCTRPSEQLGRQSWTAALKRRVAHLTHLNLGGGHPIGDKSVGKLVTLCPELETLSLQSGPAGAVLHGYDFDEQDDEDSQDVYGLLREHWSISSNDDIEHMRLTRRGLKKLAHLEHLQLDAHLTDDAPDGPRVESGYLRDDARVAAWSAFFEL